MPRIAVFGATGALGRHVARQAVDAEHAVSVLVRQPARLAAEVAARISVTTGDLAELRPEQIADFARSHDVLINCAGHVADGQAFVDLFDRIVGSIESLPAPERPLCWFLAGAALLDVDATGRRGIDLPKVRESFWPHRINFARLQRSDIDWRVLCPGPMVDQPALGVERMRVTVERLPVEMTGMARLLPAPLLLLNFATKVPEMVVPYADAAALMLANIERDDRMARKRVGIALPRGMRGKKDPSSGRPASAPSRSG